MALLEMGCQVHPQWKSHLAYVAAVEKLVRCVRRADVLLPAADSPGLVLAAWDGADQLFLLVRLQVIREDVLSLELLLTDGTLVRSAIRVTVRNVRQES